MTALCSGKICTIFPEKGALNFWKACTIALEYSQKFSFVKLSIGLSMMNILILLLIGVAMYMKRGLSDDRNK